MKRILFFLLVVIIGLISCNSIETENDIKVVGNIDHKVNCEINLSKNGNIVKGYLLNTDSNQKIKLNGTIVENHLRLEEYAKVNKLTGVFDGVYKDESYTGFWLSPNNKTKVPFSFYSKNQSIEQPKIQKQRNLKSEYLKWVKRINLTDGFCTNEECEKPNSGCEMTIIENFPDEIIYGDINNDGKKDAFIYAEIQPCMMGTWFVNLEMAGLLVVFVSKSNGKYEIFNRPDEINSELGVGRVTKVEGTIIYAEGLGLDGETLHSIGTKWDCKFEFNENQFTLISKSNEEKYNY